MNQYKTILNISKAILFSILIVGLGMSQGCRVQKNEFNKKKYKIRKGMPPAQRYYNKHSIFRGKK